MLRIHLVEGQNLVAKDNMMGGMVKGKSDPYVKIQVGGETFKSQVIKENLNPVWNEMYEVGISTLDTMALSGMACSRTIHAICAVFCMYIYFIFSLPMQSFAK